MQCLINWCESIGANLSKSSALAFYSVTPTITDTLNAQIEFFADKLGLVALDLLVGFEWME